MQNKIVILGGSFNPPTIAHLKLMLAAIDAVDARLGIFSPTRHEYVARKMKRQKYPQEVLSEAIRVEMLESMCKSDARLTVNTNRLIYTEQAYDYEMLLSLQEEYPNDELYFVTGSDKLYILPRWGTIEKLLERFRILVAKRGEDDLEQIKMESPFLTEHWERFQVFPIPEDTIQISSSAFREKLRNGDKTAYELVTADIWKILDKNGKIPWNAISDFRGEDYNFLSNFYEADINYDGLTYGSNEAAFQAQKCLTREEKILFTEYSPSKSKGIGRHVQLRPDWEQVKVEYMEEIVRAKFTQHPELATLLLNTGDKVIVEGNTWGDVFWGVNTQTGQGENHLGIILMKIRGELRNSIKV